MPRKTSLPSRAVAKQRTNAGGERINIYKETIIDRIELGIEHQQNTMTLENKIPVSFLPEIQDWLEASGYDVEIINFVSDITGRETTQIKVTWE